MSFDQRRSQHDRFYQEVRAWFNALGYMTASSTYHDHWDNAAAETIRSHFDPTSLYVRFRADNVAIHSDLSVASFQWDAKTNQSEQYANMSIEIIPLIIHKIMSDAFSVSCLYCYHDPLRNIHAGFWAGAVPPLDRIVIPVYRWDAVMVNWFQEIIHGHFPATRTILSDRTNGSGTPFAIITEREVRKLSHWKLLVEQFSRQEQA